MSVLKTMMAGGGNSVTSPPIGEMVFTSSTLWTCPDDVYFVSAVCVGAGGNSIQDTYANSGAGGGGLGWKNNIPVVPGQSYVVNIGTGGSYFISSSLVCGFNGTNNGSGYPGTGGGFVGDGGGSGGSGGQGTGPDSNSLIAGGGGGGAGGYTGNGGSGGMYASAGGNGSGGGGGGGSGTQFAYGSPPSSYDGGGVFLYGQGTSGTGGASSGAVGTDGSYAAGETAYGAGAGSNVYGRSGKPGAVRIIWGNGRGFPTSSTSLITDPKPSQYSIRNYNYLQFISRTFTSNGNLQSWTMSGWVKYTPGNRCVLLCAGSSSQPYTFFGIDSVGGLFFDQVASNTAYARKYTQDSGNYSYRFSDPTDWYHLVFVWDSNNAVASDRVRIYVNGARLTSFVLDINPSLGLASYINQTYTHYLTSFFTTWSSEALYSEINFVDGLSLDASYFGENGANGQWVPKSYSGSYGTNGFRLRFDDTNVAARLGRDSSGRGNNWTISGFSTSEDYTRDALRDSPMNNINRINHLSRAYLPYPINAGYALSSSASYSGSLVSNLAMTGGKFYFESTGFASLSGRQFRIGIADVLENPASIPGYGANSYCASVGDTGNSVWYITNNSSSVYTGLSADPTNTTFMIAFDAVTGKLWFGANGTWYNNGDPVAGTNPTYTANASLMYGPVFWCSSSSGGTVVQYPNFGQRNFKYPPPTGFKTVSAKNISSTPYALSGYSFTGHGSTDGTYVNINAAPSSLTINGNPVTWGTHALKTSSGFKLITASSSYNASGNNSFTVTATSAPAKYSRAQVN